MMNEEIFVIGKKDDYLFNFWKIPRGDCDSQTIVKVLEYLNDRKKFFNYPNYSGIAKLDVWDRNDYTELYDPFIYNVDGLPWPKHIKELTLYPKANIRTVEDLEAYNKWRMTIFKSFVSLLQNNYKWVRKDGIIPVKSLRDGWMNVKIDEIAPLEPVELKLSDNVLRAVKRYISVRKDK